MAFVVVAELLVALTMLSWDISPWSRWEWTGQTSAAWVQAIGSLAALGIALFLARVQAKEQARRDEARWLEHRLGQFSALLHAWNEWGMMLVRASEPGWAKGEVRIDRDEVNDLRQRLRAIDQTGLPQELRGRMFQLRDAMSNALLKVQWTDEVGAHQWLLKARNHANGISKQLEAELADEKRFKGHVPGAPDS